MKTSELIKLLEAEMQSRGDINVYFGGDEGPNETTSVDFEAYNPDCPCWPHEDHICIH
jgi:hypothetical protein